MNAIEFRGQRFDLTYAAFSSGPDGKLTFELMGSEVRGEAFGGEFCGPYLRIEGVDPGSSEEIEVSWHERDVDFANRTYFTLFGEGFSLISGTLKLARMGGEGMNLSFNGETDFPPDDASKGIRFKVFATPSESTPKPW